MRSAWKVFPPSWPEEGTHMKRERCLAGRTVPILAEWMQRGPHRNAGKMARPAGAPPRPRGARLLLGLPVRAARSGRFRWLRVPAVAPVGRLLVRPARQRPVPARLQCHRRLFQASRRPAGGRPDHRSPAGALPGRAGLRARRHPRSPPSATPPSGQNKPPDMTFLFHCELSKLGKVISVGAASRGRGRVFSAKCPTPPASARE